MTVAVGISHNDVLVVAADSQESTESTKLAIRKIALSWYPTRRPSTRIGPGLQRLRNAVAITGTGSSDYLRYLKEEVRRTFVATDPPDGDTADHIEVFEQALRKLMCDFFDNTYMELQQDPYPPEPWLIVAARSANGAVGLWQTHRKTVTSMSSSLPGIAVVGHGEMWAKYALKSFGADSYTNLTSASLAAAYAIFVAKENDVYCGKETSMVALRRDSLDLSGQRRAIQYAESIFREYDEFASDILRQVTSRSSLLERPSYSKEPRIDERFEDIRKQLAGIDFYDPRWRPPRQR